MYKINVYYVMYLSLVRSLLWQPVHMQHLYLDLFIVDLVSYALR